MLTIHRQYDTDALTPRFGAYPNLDARRVARLLQGEPDAQRRFITRYRRLVSRTLQSLGLPEQEREDLVHLAFQHLWEHDYRLLWLWQDRGKCSLRTYLRVVVARFAYEHQHEQTTSSASAEDYHRETIRHSLTSVSDNAGDSLILLTGGTFAVDSRRHPSAVALAGFLDGNIPPRRTSQIVRHLQHCSRCFAIMQGSSQPYS